ncbi:MULTISPECIES: LysR substrate-binding domain-containing protein [unclassified Brevundimonas]|uniref:LysR substrate-binding domain-containing protein n=1 Tax=unclassified Brevundimonas TaxID=2622653 RepID=UPI0025C2CCF9|nr:MULTISPECIES: LysR substrate-binding domain-containing protein [unclassified Brevundimonas]
MFENLTSGAALPSLNALRAFEAMARTGSATLAGAELNVTHSAVSRQVKALEAQMGVRLFEGPRHALTLTRGGRDLLPGLTAAFDGVAAAVARARSEGQDLHVAVNASLSVKWLIPRLADFGRLHPEIRVHLVELAPHAVSRRGADVVLRLLDPERIESLKAEVVTPSAVGPVIAPALAGPDARAAILAAPRLTARTHLSGWTDWSALSGHRSTATSERPVAHLHFVLDAALAGWGAAVLPWALAAEAVTDGRLLAPFGFQPDGAAVAAIPGAGEPSRARRAFVRWLVDQGRAMRPAPPST